MNTCTKSNAALDVSQHNRMMVTDLSTRRPAGGASARVFGEPYETPDGTTVVTVGTTGRFATRAVGVFVVHEGKVHWEPAFDGTRIALMGELIGLVAAGFATFAMVRRPPWPDVRLRR